MQGRQALGGPQRAVLLHAAGGRGRGGHAAALHDHAARPRQVHHVLRRAGLLRLPLLELQLLQPGRLTLDAALQVRLELELLPQGHEVEAGHVRALQELGPLLGQVPQLVLHPRQPCACVVCVLLELVDVLQLLHA